MSNKSSLYRFVSIPVVLGGVLMTLTCAPAAAEVLIRATFDKVSETALLGPDIVPPAGKWVNDSGHEAQSGSGFAEVRNLSRTYDQDNKPETPEVNIPGGYEVNGYVDTEPNHTLTIKVTMPKALNAKATASLRFWAALRVKGSGAGSGVRIRNAKDNVDVVPLTIPRFAADPTHGQLNQFTFPQSPSYVGAEFEISFVGGGLDGASGLELTDITFETDTDASPSQPAPASLQSAALIRARADVAEEKDASRHAQLMQEKQDALKQGPVNLVFIGDSITDLWRGKVQNKLYYERWGKYNPYNIGVSGDETQHVLWRIGHGELDGLQPNLVVMMIGTNNIANQNKMSPEDTAVGVRSLVKVIQEKLPETRILLLGVFPRGARSDDRLRGLIKSLNQAIAGLDDGGKRVRFLDIGDKFLDQDGNLPADIMPDALHPSEKGYHIWADAMGPAIDAMMP